MQPQAAYCNDKYLVLISNKAPSWAPNLDDVPNPPGGTQTDGTACVTRMSSVTSSFRVDIVPLSFTLLPTDSDTNNIGAFPGGAGDGNGGYRRYWTTLLEGITVVGWEEGAGERYREESYRRKMQNKLIPSCD